MKYLVGIREVHVNTVEVEAENQEDAIEKARSGECFPYDLDIEYSHTLGHDTWTVEKGD